MRDSFLRGLSCSKVLHIAKSLMEGEDSVR